MKKKMIVTVMAMGLLSIGALSASAAGACDNCTGKQAMQQFTQETSALTSELKAKNIQLRELYGAESLDVYKANQLEAEIKELKNKIDSSASKLGVSPCNRG